MHGKRFVCTVTVVHVGGVLHFAAGFAAYYALPWIIDPAWPSTGSLRQRWFGNSTWMRSIGIGYFDMVCNVFVISSSL